MADKKDTNTTDTPSRFGGKKKKIIIIGAAVLLLLLAGLGAAGYFLFLREDPEPEKASDPGLDVPVPQLSQKSDIGPMVDINEFIVNIISGENNHYVKASLTLELNNDLAAEEITKRMPQIRDSILLLVGNKTYDELQDLQGKRQLKAELTSKINAILQSGRVKSIYFTDFVVQ